MGQLSIREIAPVGLLWSAVILGFLFALRFDYSVYFITFSALTMLAFFMLSGYLKIRYSKKVVAYIPTERITQLPASSTIIWEKLIDPDQPVDKNRVNIVMADLRGKLSNEWKQFLATCTLHHIPVYHSSRLIEMLSGRVKIDHMYENVTTTVKLTH